MKRLRMSLGYDWWLVFAYLALVMVGLVFVYSASTDYSLLHFDDPYYLIRRQALFALVGIGVALVVSWLDYRLWRRWAFWGLALSLVGMAVVVVVHFIAGSIGRFLVGSSVQPSELAKVAYVLYLAVWLEARQDRLADSSWGLWPFLMVLGALAFLAALEPDLSAIITFAMIGGILFFLGGAPLKQVAWLLVLGIVGGGGGAWLVPHGRERILRYLAGLHDVQQTYDQVQFALMAFARGGWLGRGIGNSVVKVSGLPLAPNDAIFAVIGEELGVLGALVVMGLFGVLLWRGVRLAQQAPDVMGRLLAAGLALWLVLEAWMNMAAVINVIPMTGNALPFISAGGTNAVVSSAAVGLMLSVGRRIAQEQSTQQRSVHAVVDLRRGHGRRRVSRPRRASAAGR